MREHHLGRLIDHIHLRSRHLKRARRFYRAIFEGLGVPVSETDTRIAADEFWLDAGERMSAIHLAFQAASRADVVRLYQLALGAGGQDNGAPGERDYHPGYYAAFVLDPDGNNIEFVHHGPAKRSAKSIMVTPEPPG
jgi:catechol 2,3-dioxygenase-like lactoylglutathione lyase family enzyme